MIKQQTNKQRKFFFAQNFFPLFFNFVNKIKNTKKNSINDGGGDDTQKRKQKKKNSAGNKNYNQHHQKSLVEIRIFNFFTN